MVKIRLMRLGAKKRPFFRVVVADARSPRDGRIIENLGKYHPLEEPSLIEIDGDRALHWLKNGAQPTAAVVQLLKIKGVWETFTGEPTPVQKVAAPKKSKKAKAKEAAPVETPAAAPVAAAAPPPAEAPPAEAPAEPAPAAAETTEAEPEPDVPAVEAGDEAPAADAPADEPAEEPASEEPASEEQA